jgi:HTH-type transcriptional regulator / antitoxin HigA
MGTSKNDFQPDWTSAPGETISDLLAERDISLADFANRMNFSAKDATDLLEGRSTITIDVARKLKETVGGSVEFWVSRDYQYREDVARLTATDRQWLHDFPLSDMVKFGWLAPVHPTNEVEACLEFFGVTSVGQWHQRYARVEQLAAFRTSRSFESRPAAVAAWLRRGEIEGASIECKPWDPSLFANSLTQIRKLTREKDPKKFLPRLTEICAESGVAFVVVRCPTGCRASGATRMLAPDKILIQLSFRYLADDQFWFSFFHEAGHALRHANKGLFVDGIGDETSVEESEANDVAIRAIIPEEMRNDLERLRCDSTHIIRFAQSVGVAPGLIVGQLQHAGRLAHNRLNTLKRRYKWDD